MLREWVLWLGTPVPWPLRRIGYLRASISLHARSRRCRAAWAPHLATCRAVVRRAVADPTARRRAVVLGSGLLDEREEDRTGAVIDRPDLMHRVALPATADAWDRELAPFGEATRERRLIHRVRAYPDWAKARGRSRARASGGPT